MAWHLVGNQPLYQAVIIHWVHQHLYNLNSVLLSLCEANLLESWIRHSQSQLCIKTSHGKISSCFFTRLPRSPHLSCLQIWIQIHFDGVWVVACYQNTSWKNCYVVWILFDWFGLDEEFIYMTNYIYDEFYIYDKLLIITQMFSNPQCGLLNFL